MFTIKSNGTIVANRPICYIEFLQSCEICCRLHRQCRLSSLIYASRGMLVKYTETCRQSQNKGTDVRTLSVLKVLGTIQYQITLECLHVRK
jgi:hypothetical protein